MAERVVGFTSLLDGMNAGVAPALLPLASYARGVNVSSRGGLLRTRPAFVYQASIGTGTFQGAGRWSLNSGDRIVSVISGRVLVTRVSDFATQDLGVLMGTTGQCFFGQADRYLWIQDGVSPAVVLQETSTQAAEVVSNAIPVGSIMQFVHGRMHMVPKVVPGTTEPGGPYFISSDVALPDDPANVLQFTETEYWNEGGALGLPNELGFIRGLAAYRNAATGTGVGGLIVLAREGAAAFDMSVERSNWKNLNLGQVLFFGAGTDSPWSVMSINNDVVYRSQDGIRFIRYTASSIAGGGASLSNIPQSNEVHPFLDMDEEQDLPYVSAAQADNRLLVTVAGSQDHTFRGLVSLDFAQVHGFRGADAPSYDGVYTGLKFLQVVNARKDRFVRSFAFHQRGSEVVLYAADPDASQDDSGTAKKSIKSRVVTRSFDFENIELKKLKYAELWMSDIRVPTQVTVWWRPNGYPLWSKAGEQLLDVPDGFPPQVRRKVRISFPQDSSAGNPVTGESLLLGQDFQFAIEFTGFAQIDKFRVVADSVAETVPAPCAGAAVELAAGTLPGEELDDFDYLVEA